jgi:hypothetical protein
MFTHGLAVVISLRLRRITQKQPRCRSAHSYNKFQHLFSQASYSAAPEKCQLYRKRL